MSKLLSRHDRWELWMAATPGAQTSEPASPAQPAAPAAVTNGNGSHHEPRAPGDLVREVERLRGVVQTAVAALALAGAHDEASRIKAALGSR